MRVIFNVTPALLVSVAVGILMVNVSSLPWMGGPPSQQPALAVCPSTTTELARLTLPKPELLGDVPASLGMYCPASSSAQLMRSALMRAAEGLEIPFATSVCHSTAAYPTM